MPATLHWWRIFLGRERGIGNLDHRTRQPDLGIILKKNTTLSNLERQRAGILRHALAGLGLLRMTVAAVITNRNPRNAASFRIP
jgi:hypothetical protein